MRPRQTVGFFTFLLLGAVATATDARTDFRAISEFHHTAWTSEEGAPGDTWMLAQTPDGWLWVGGPRGVFRFDGTRWAMMGPESGFTDVNPIRSHPGR